MFDNTCRFDLTNITVHDVLYDDKLYQVLVSVPDFTADIHLHDDEVYAGNVCLYIYRDDVDRMELVYMVENTRTGEVCARQLPLYTIEETYFLMAFSRFVSEHRDRFN